VTFTNWKAGQPDNFAGLDRSLWISQPDGKWGDALCTHRREFICEWDGHLGAVPPSQKPIGNRRPPRNAVAFGGHHYALIEQPAVTWHVAQDLCASQGGHLVRIQSPEEFEWVKTLIANSQSPEFWVDGNDEASEGVWVDADGEPLAYLPWPPGLPDNGAYWEHVAILPQDGKLNDVPCGGRHAFICEWDR
jgi:C-type mannose receptor